MSILHDQADLLQGVHGYLSDIYSSERKLSDIMDAMLDELEDDEVQAMM